MVSVIVPCYNHGGFIRETIESILKSTYADLEIWIVDDGSIDDSRHVGLSLDAQYPNVNYLHQSNSGPSSARNNGIKHSQGKYILALDADDLISQNYIEEAVSVLDSDEDVKVVYAEAEKFGAVNELWKLKPFSLLQLAQDNMIYVSAIYRREDWNRIGGYTENNVLVREDWEFWIKLLKDGGKVIKLPFVGFYYRIQSNSRRKGMSSEKKKNEIAYLNKQYPTFFQQYLGGPLRNRRSWSIWINKFMKS